MPIIEKDSKPFEPYARLMNILGDQLITDKKIAVIEILKNSYDADAENVQVRFINMDNYGKSYLTELERPYIEVEDDGDGMTLETIKNVWLRPATPIKLDKKKRKENFTKKGRIIQGEKGIGRFATHKLGEKIEIYTKTRRGNEIKLVLDFTEYDPEKVDLFNQPPSDYKLLSEVNNEWVVYSPPEVIKKDKGTVIRIYNLRESWAKHDYTSLYQAIRKLIPPYDPNAEAFQVIINKDFDVTMYLNGEIYSAESSVTFEDIIDRAPFKMSGIITEEGTITFDYKSEINNRKVKRTISIINEDSFSKYSYDLYSYTKWFSVVNKKPQCGGFKFSFYAYDLGNKDITMITKDEREFIKSNFIYVIRDGVRVYPFGEKEYDWLELDKLRAVVRAGFFPSYNDIIGFIYISQEENPLLKDSSNRQGMMNIDGAYDDFKYFSLALTEILNAEAKIDKEKRKIQKNRSVLASNEIVENSFKLLQKNLEKINDTDTLKKANKFFDTVKKHTDLLRDRVDIVEDLAGLGMAVEKASHDTLTLMSKMRGNLKDFKIKTKNQDYTNKELLSFLNEIDEGLDFVYEQMQVIQPLFKFQRKHIKDVSIYESIEKVVKYFRKELDKDIDCKIIKGKDLIVKTNPGLILQVLINLFDNAIYWVNKTKSKRKELIIKINTTTQTIIIADNGPGIDKEIAPHIFTEFFTMKADGRGLGLYIAKEILQRIGANISLIKNEHDKQLPGANFLINFNVED